MNEAIEKSCPDHGVLVDFLQGRLVPPELERCESHVETCDACHETLSGINASDTLSEVVAKAMQPHPPTTDDADVVQNLVRRLGKSSGFADTQDQASGKQLLRDRAAEVLLHVAPDPEDHDSLGVLAGFRLLELIGAGGTGVVFRAQDLSLQREVALKVLRPSLGDLARERFVAEARAAASIDHENVVAIYQVGEQKRLAWIAMKWVPGETLESRLNREGSLGEEQVRQLSKQIANGLAEAHRQQLVHRDIKPANIWIGDADGKIRILDFGLVRITDNDPALTATGMLAGTPNFMSPEQAKGQELDARSDLFSLGCVMYQMITGTLPFGSPTILATLQSIQAQQPEPPKLFADDCSDELSDLTMALLEKQPANRVDSAESLVRCLETPRNDWPADIKRRMASKRDTNESELKPTTTTQGGGFGAGTLIGAVLLGLLGFGMWFFAPQIIRIATNHGELVIETDDENVEVTISQDGDVRVLDTDSGASFDIRSGEIQISAVGKDGKTEFEVDRNQLTMQRGGREVVRVTQKKQVTSSPMPRPADGMHEKAQSVFEGHTFDTWLQIAQTEKQADVRANAVLACSTLLESDQQFNLLLPMFSIVGESHPILTILDDLTVSYPPVKKGQHLYNDNVFFQSFRKLSVAQAVELLKFQFKNESDLALVNTVTAFDAMRMKHYSQEQTLRELKPNAAEIIRLASLRKKQIPYISGFFLEPLETLTNEKIAERTVESEILYKGKQLAEWLNVLEIDRNPQTQSEALKACAALYASSDRDDELMAVLNSYLQRNTTNAQLYQGKDQADCFSGFSNSLKTLPPQKIVEILKLQLRQGDETTIDWTYRGMSIQSGKGRVPFSAELRAELATNAADVLRLIADLNNDYNLSSLFRFLVGFVPKDSVSDETVYTIRAIMLKQYKLDPGGLFSATKFVPQRVLAPELFVSVKSRLFAADTPTDERDFLVKELLRIQRDSNGHAPFILEILAEVIANQIYDPAGIKFDHYQTMSVFTRRNPDTQESEHHLLGSRNQRRSKISGGAVVARLLLSEICERLLDEETASPDEVAKRVLVILSKPPSSKPVAIPTELELFQMLQIDHDIEALKRLSKKQPGEFSDFIDGERKFGGDSEVAPTPQTEIVVSPALSSIGEGRGQESLENAETRKQYFLLLSGLADSERLFKPEIDGSVRLSLGNMNESRFFRFFSHLSAKQAVEFLKLQLKDGSNQAVINTFLALDEWGDEKNNSERELLGELRPNAPELLRLANLRKKPQPIAFNKFLSVLESLNDKEPNAKTDDQEPELYKGKQLSKWLKVLEIDQDPPTQGIAVKACATLYESRGQNEETVALLKSYVKRHATSKNFLQDKDQFACFLGFAESLEKLPPKTVVEFLKFQLKQGDEFAIGWAYMGLIKPRDPSNFSIFTKFKPYSSELKKELKPNAVELLRLIADHDKVGSLNYLLGFVVDNLLEEPLSDDTISAIRAAMVKLEPKGLLKAVTKVPTAVLDQELFASVKARLLATNTSKAERDELVQSLTNFEKKAKGKATFILETLAEVAANQLYAPNKVEFDELQKMKVYAAKEPSEDGENYRASGFFIPNGFKKTEIKGSAIMARRLLGTICERLLDKDITSPEEVAKRVLVILSNGSAAKQAADPTDLEHFNQLKIDFDIEELKKLAEKQDGKFSDFISGKREF